MSTGTKRAWRMAVALALPVAGCGSSQHSPKNVNANPTTTGASKVFHAPGMAIHFSFPASLRSIPLGASRRVAGSSGRATHAAVGIGNYDLLVVTRFPKRPIPVTAQNIATLKPAFDQSISSAFGHSISSTVGSVGALPALSYPPVPVLGLPLSASSRVTLVFFADDEYELNCQYTQPAQATIDGACQEMLATLGAS
jgi:hypothetical protein